MNSKPVLVVICVFVMGAMFGGCTASSELGDDHQDKSASMRPDTSAVVPPVVKPSAPAQTSRQGFTTKEDTIEVESARHNHKSEHTPVTVQPARKPGTHTGFTVQVGAFKDEANALRVKDNLTRRYHKRVTEQFDGATKLYRVTVGEFATEKDASRFAAVVRKKYPREFGHAWVVRISE
jgi:cell division septation protein DedD